MIWFVGRWPTYLQYIYIYIYILQYAHIQYTAPGFMHLSGFHPRALKKLFTQHSDTHTHASYILAVAVIDVWLLVLRERLKRLKRLKIGRQSDSMIIENPAGIVERSDKAYCISGGWISRYFVTPAEVRWHPSPGVWGGQQSYAYVPSCF
ncbi:hypothetical protein F4778DRAFT_716120 [Xylariomycetidae sp. FL2044]|nr:hypothetical protein F4778DRAFT_716120 [Xylariomycetidae sp. FL2044]